MLYVYYIYKIHVNFYTFLILIYILALSTGLGVLPFFIFKQPDKFWMGISNGNYYYIVYYYYSISYYIYYHYYYHCYYYLLRWTKCYRNKR